MAKIEKKQKKSPFERKEKEVLEFKGITLITDSEDKYITQIRFKLSDTEDITHKPKYSEIIIGKHKGIKTEKKLVKSIDLEELPKKVYFLNELINENGKVRVLCDYSIMNTSDREGNEVSYKFLTEKDFVSMYPVDKDNKEIKESE